MRSVVGVVVLLSVMWLGVGSAAAGTISDVVTPSACLLTEANRPAPLASRPSYTLDLTVDLDANRVVGTSAIVFTPDLPTDRVVLRLWPNGPRGAAGGAELSVTTASVDGAPLRGALSSPTQYDVALPNAIAAGQSVTINVAWTLTLPGAIDDRVARIGDSVRLGSFHPYLAWEPGVGWAELPPTVGFAEASLNVTSDFAVRVTVPAGLDVLATGTLDPDGVYRASAVADFALSIGRFRTVAGVVPSAGASVQLVVGVAEGISESPQAYFDRVASSLDLFGVLYGAYPWPSLTLAITPELGGGIEYPTHIMQGPGTIGRTTPHEVGHMWFYSLVTNDQGRDPWLDEGMASYLEARHEGEVASFATRGLPSSVRGQTGQPMSFWDSRLSVYYRGVYVQGAQVIATLGRQRHIDCAVRAHAILLSNRVATNAAVVGIYTDVFPWAPQHFAAFGIPPG